jgi:hypothetical protein
MAVPGGIPMTFIPGKSIEINLPLRAFPAAGLIEYIDTLLELYSLGQIQK